MPGIILEDIKTVYWAIPKNCCTSMKVRIAQKQGLEFTNPHDAPFKIGSKKLKGYEHFAIVRNPYSRIYSLWVNKIAPGHPIGEKFINGIDPNVFSDWMNIFYSEMTFEKFIEEIIKIPANKADPHFALQTSLMPPNCKIYKMEDANTLLRTILDITNKGHIDEPWQNVITGNLKNIIYNHYEKDFLTFGYEY